MICQFCNTSQALYVCPKCNSNYCSLRCYRDQKHLQCTEEFYKDWVKTCLASDTADPIMKQKMTEILKRVHNEGEQLDSDDDADVDPDPDLEDRVADINFNEEVDPELLWSRLTDAEKKEFEEMIEKGAEKIIPVWVPWWTNKKQPVLVEEVGSKPTQESSSDSYPPVVENIPQLTAITKRPPSETIKNDLVNVLFCYAFLARLYNGDHSDFSIEASKMLIDLSPVLRENMTFQDVRQAIQFSIQRLISKKTEYSTTEESILLFVQDVILLVENSTKLLSFEYVLRALSDVKYLFGSAKRELKKSMKCKEKSKGNCDIEPTLNILPSLMKKIDYYLSWTIQFGTQLEELLPQISIEYASIAENMASHSKAASVVKSSKGPLIVELTS